jgi:quinone-modifying oxidoreductase subunit QmoA
MMERLAAIDGPTLGKIIRPSDGKEVRNVAFVQCAGSRDENHLPYCSAVCCLASLKQSFYVRERYPDSKVYIFYIDIRTPGKYEDFYVKVQDDKNVTLVKGKVSKIEEDQKTKDLIVEADDTLSGNKVRLQVEMAVLATGMVPVANESGIANLDITYDQYGFIQDGQQGGIYTAGVAKMPTDVASSVRSGSATALKAIQCVRD